MTDEYDSVCEAAKVIARMKGVMAREGKPLLSGRGLVVSFSATDTVDMTLPPNDDKIDFCQISRGAFLTTDYRCVDGADQDSGWGSWRGPEVYACKGKYDFVIVVGREIMPLMMIEGILSLAASNGFVVFYCANPHYVVTSYDAYQLKTPNTEISNAESMHDFLVKIGLVSQPVELIDCLAFSPSESFRTCDKSSSEYFYQVVVKTQNTLFGTRAESLKDDDAQLVSLDD